MDTLFFNKDCPFHQVREQIKSYFLNLELTLNIIRDKLYEEVTLKEHEWIKAIEQLKSTRALVNLRLQPNTTTFKTKQRVLNTLDLSMSQRPYVNIKWDYSVKLLEVTNDKRIAEVVYLIPDEEREARPSSLQFQRENSPNYYNIQMKNRQYSYPENDMCIFSQQTTDSDRTPFENVNFENTVNSSSTYLSPYNTMPRKHSSPNPVHSPSLSSLLVPSNDTYIPSLHRHSFTKSCEENNLPTLHQDEYRTVGRSGKSLDQSDEHIPTVLLGNNRGYEGRQVSYSVPHSPNLRNYPETSLGDWKNQSLEFEHIHFCDNKSRDCLWTDDEDNELQPLHMYSNHDRRSTITKRPNKRTNDSNDKTEEEHKSVTDIVKKFQTLSGEELSASMQECRIPSKKGRGKCHEV